MSPKHFGIHNLDIVLSVTETVVLSRIPGGGGWNGGRQTARGYTAGEVSCWVHVISCFFTTKGRHNHYKINYLDD